jgi:hypothetical protein
VSTPPWRREDGFREFGAVFWNQYMGHKSGIPRKGHPICQLRLKMDISLYGCFFIPEKRKVYTRAQL